MDLLVRWVTGDVAPIVAGVSLVLLLIVTALTPVVIKHRLRPVFVLGLVYTALVIASRQVSGAARSDLRVVAVLMASLALARFLFVLVVDLGVERAGRRPINALSRDVLQGAVYLVAAGTALRAVGIAPTSLLATGTVVTAIVGLALQETLGNLAAGVAIQVDKPIALGDWIRMDKGDFIGRVVSTNWRAVTIQTDDRTLFVIPNGLFSKGAFTNYSRPGGGARRSLYFTLPYDVAPGRAHEAILAACDDCTDVLKDPPPSVMTWTYGDSGIQYWLRFYIADFALRDRVQSEVGTRVWYHLHRRKISSAFPVQQTFVHMVDERSLARESAEVIRDRRAAIESVDFLRALPEEAKQLLAERGHRRLYAADESILRAGDTGREFYVIRRGEVAIRLGDRELARLGPGAFFGEMALLTGSARHADVFAITETEVFEVDEPMFYDVLHKDPKIAEEISRIVGERQAEMEARQSGLELPSASHVKGASTEILSKIRKLFALD